MLHQSYIGEVYTTKYESAFEIMQGKRRYAKQVKRSVHIWKMNPSKIFMLKIYYNKFTILEVCSDNCNNT